MTPYGFFFPVHRLRLKPGCKPRRDMSWVGYLAHVGSIEWVILSPLVQAGEHRASVAAQPQG